MKFILLFLALTYTLGACSPAMKFSKDKSAFMASKTIASFKAVADMNDAYFDIKENNFFEFYRQLFDSVKNTSYPGRFTLTGDTMFLQFYDKKGKDLLGTKAVVHAEKKEILFYK